MDYGQAFDATGPSRWEVVTPTRDVEIWNKYEQLVARWWGNEARAISETAARLGVSYRKVQEVLDSRYKYLYSHGYQVHTAN